MIPLEEIKTKLNIVKAGKDVIFAEIFCYSGNHLVDIMCIIIMNTWNVGRVPNDWRDAIMIPLCKGIRELCICYCSISAVKILVGDFAVSTEFSHCGYDTAKVIIWLLV